MPRYRPQMSPNTTVLCADTVVEMTERLNAGGV